MDFQLVFDLNKRLSVKPKGKPLGFCSMVRTIPPKVDKADTSSVEAPMAQLLVARPRSKVSDGNPADDDPDLLNFVVVESRIVC
jgi:hypothetical protein